MIGRTIFSGRLQDLGIILVDKFDSLYEIQDFGPSHSSETRDSCLRKFYLTMFQNNDSTSILDA